MVDDMAQYKATEDVLERIAELNRELDELRETYLHLLADQRPVSNVEAFELLTRGTGMEPSSARDMVQRVNEGRWKRWYRTATVNMLNGAITVEDLLDPDSVAKRFHIEPWSTDAYCSTLERLDAALEDAGFRRLADWPWRQTPIEGFWSARVTRTGANGLGD